MFHASSIDTWRAGSAKYLDERVSAACEQEVTAFHEAGHAVADHWHSFPIEEVSITGGKGAVRLTGRKTISMSAAAAVVQRETQIREMICLLSATHAVRYFFGVPDDRATRDRERALELALKLNEGDAQDAELLMAWCDHCAKNLVKGEAKQIHKLAFALLEFDRLSGDQVCELLGRNGSDGER